MEQKKIKILVCHHKEAPYVKNECVLPIQVGRALHANKLDYCIGDDTGENISAKNPYWCELTALYWAWKNLDADYYGLMHYRRYLSFSNDEQYNIITSLKNRDVVSSMSPENIRKMCEDYDIITGPIWDIHPVNLDNLIMTAYDFYEREHEKKDLDFTLEIIKQKYPQYYFAALDSITSTKCFFMNLMVLKKELFFSYCSFLFGVLEEVEKKISLKGRDSYQKRVFGFLAERLSNIFVLYCQQNDESVRIKHTGMFFLADTNDIDVNKIITYCEEREYPINQVENSDARIDDCINICMSFDDNYLAPALTALMSLTKHTKSKLRLYILCDSHLSIKSRTLIKNSLSNHIVEFINVQPGILKYLPLNREHISIYTYYRLLIHNLIDADKVIYLDADIIVMDDIEKLWNIDIGKACVAGVLDEGGVTQSRRLKLGNDANYINAGVMIFNIKEIKNKYPNISSEYIETYYSYRKYIILQDQDIINIKFNDEIYILPMKWNMSGRIFEKNELDYKYRKEDIIAALDDMGILHFTDRRKPWSAQSMHPLKSLYWSYRRRIDILPMSYKENIVYHFQKRISYTIDGNRVYICYLGRKFDLSKSLLKRILNIVKK